MLHTGEEVGDGDGPDFELAIDPLEGTDYCASGLDGAIAVLAVGPPGSLWATSGYYMNKLTWARAPRGRSTSTRRWTRTSTGSPRP